MCMPHVLAMEDTVLDRVVDEEDRQHDNRERELQAGKVESIEDFHSYR